MPSVIGVSHLGLTVRNLRASEEWYRRVFGLERIHEDRSGTYESVTLQDPESEMVVSLTHHHAAGSARFDETRTGLDHVSFGVADKSTLEEWERRLTELSIEHTTVSETEFGSMLVFRDPDHIQLELFCRGRPILRVADEQPVVTTASEEEEPSVLIPAPAEAVEAPPADDVVA